MSFSVEIQKTDFSGLEVVVPGLGFYPERYSHASIGGPRQAIIRVEGKGVALWQVLGLLAHPVVITDNDTHRPVWWGEIQQATARVGPISLTTTLRDVYNRVKCTYEMAYGDQASLLHDLAWSSDTTSIARYGQREYVRALGRTTSVAAAFNRAIFLATHKDPVIINPQFDAPKSDGGQLLCVGYWDRLGLRHLDMDSIAVASYTAITGKLDYQLTNTGNKVFQSFTPATNQQIDLVELFVTLAEDQDNPDSTASGNTRVEIWSGASLPTTLVATSDDVGAQDIHGGAMHWFPFNFASPVALTGGTKYWIGASKGSIRGADYRVKVVAPASGYAGTLVKYDRRRKTDPFAYTVMDADMPFIAHGKDDSATLVSDIITAVGSEWATGVDIDVPSGNTFSRRREPDANARDDIEEMLAAGTSNARRLLAAIRSDRRVFIYEQPAYSDTVAYKVTTDHDGKPAFLDPLGNAYPLTDCPVGVWLRVVDPRLRSPIDGRDLAFFVEENEYDINAGVPRIRTQGQVDYWDFSVIQALGVPQL